MKNMKLILGLLVILICAPMAAVAQNKVTIVPLGDSFVPIVSPGEPDEPSPYLDDAVDKPIIWNKGWDQNIGHRTQIDPTVQITSFRLSQGGYLDLIYTANEIRHWGEQTVYTGSNSPIYAKGVLLVDKGAALEGGVFEWSLNLQGFMSFKNIQKTGSSTPWVQAWTDPRPGEKVWFFIMSDDERFSSNPITFIWP